ncbi:hypothetical protein FQR65_LT16428 [Abscondita terminalis]|nr:hypothetical protein FQR65_LT16428 [Abscondita terminalis]
MDKTGYTALVLGSTGLIGSFLVEMLLDNTQYSTVYAVSRSPLQLQHPGFINIVADADSIAHHLENIAVDHLYCCLGSTKSKTPDLSAYYKIDHDYPLSVTQQLKIRGISASMLVSRVWGLMYYPNNFLSENGKRDLSADIEFTSMKEHSYSDPLYYWANATKTDYWKKYFCGYEHYKLFPNRKIKRLQKYKSSRRCQVNDACVNMKFEKEILPVLNISNKVDKITHITVTSKIPLATIDKSKVKLTEDSVARTNFQLQKDTLNDQLYHIRFNWKPKRNYTLVLEEKALTGLFGDHNKELKTNFTLDESENYGDINFNFTNTDSTMQYVVELIDDKKEKVFNSRY